MYTASLSTALVGFSWASIADDIIFGATAAVCYLRWKFVTEYIDPDQFKDFIAEIEAEVDNPPPT
jgi:hypothetical protein